MSIFHKLILLMLLAETILAQSYLMPQPDYSIPYTIPSVEGIEKKMNDIKNYFYAVTPYKIINRDTGDEITDFKEVDSSAVIDTRMGRYNLWIYEMGVVHRGMLYAGEVLGDSSFTKYPIRNFNFIFDHLPYFRKKAAEYGIFEDGLKRIIIMDKLDNCGAMGASLIEANYICKYERFSKMIKEIADFIMNKQFRLSDGTFARPLPQKESVWLDDLYMSVPFLAEMGKLKSNDIYFDEAVKQVLLFSEKLFVYEKNLFDHGINMNSSADPDFYWGRANGWAMLAMVDLLSLLPQNHKDRARVLELYRLQVKGLAELQDAGGMWHNLLDKNDSFLESSATAMFTYGIAKGVNEKWIDYTYGAVALNGWNALQKNIMPSGQMENVCIGTGFADDIVYYYHRPTSPFALHGYGPALLAGAEIIKLIKNERFHIDKDNDSFRFTE